MEHLCRALAGLTRSFGRGAILNFVAALMLEFGARFSNALSFADYRVRAPRQPIDKATFEMVVNNKPMFMAFL